MARSAAVSPVLEVIRGKSRSRIEFLLNTVRESGP
jgi:hypothetical protein